MHMLIDGNIAQKKFCNKCKMVWGKQEIHVEANITYETINVFNLERENYEKISRMQIVSNLQF